MDGNEQDEPKKVTELNAHLAAAASAPSVDHKKRALIAMGNIGKDVQALALEINELSSIIDDQVTARRLAQILDELATSVEKFADAVAGLPTSRDA